MGAPVRDACYPQREHSEIELAFQFFKDALMSAIMMEAESLIVPHRTHTVRSLENPVVLESCTGISEYETAMQNVLLIYHL